METYYESAELIQITRKRVVQEYRDHGFGFDEMQADIEAGRLVPDANGLFDAQQVLICLGY